MALFARKSFRRGGSQEGIVAALVGPKAVDATYHQNHNKSMEGWINKVGEKQGHEKEIRAGTFVNVRDLAAQQSRTSRPGYKEKEQPTQNKQTAKREEMSISLTPFEDAPKLNAAVGVTCGRNSESNILTEWQQGNQQHIRQSKSRSIYDFLQLQRQQQAARLREPNGTKWGDFSKVSKSGVFQPPLGKKDTLFNGKENKQGYPLTKNGQQSAKKHSYQRSLIETHYRQIRLDRPANQKPVKLQPTATKCTKIAQNRKRSFDDSGFQQQASTRNFLLVRRIIKDLCRVSCRYGLRTSLLTRQQFGLILNELGFLSPATTGIVNEFWEYLACGTSTTSMRNLLYLIGWIHGVYSKDLLEKALSESAHVIFRRQENLEYGTEFPSEQEVRQAKSKLEQLYLNSLNSQCLNNSQRQLLRSRSEQDLTFQPQLSDRTKRLAKQQRAKQPDATNLHQRRQSCTAAHCQSMSDLLRKDEQFKTVEKESFRKKSNRSGSRGRLYGSCVPHETSAASTTKKVRLRSGRANFPRASNFEKEVVRMLQARKSKGRLPLPQPAQVIAPQEQPVMKLDIYIDSSGRKLHKHQLVFYSADEPNEVVNRFSSKFEVSQGVRQRLSQLILQEYQKHG